MKQAISVAMILVFLLVGVPAWAHHSFAAFYDMEAPITVEGVIVEVRLTNPHSWFYLDVTNENGEVERWRFEAGTPGGMIRNGYSAEVIPQGSTVTIRGFRALDPADTAGMLRELVAEDGTVYGMFGPRETSTR